jgi:hypothetical protein
VDKQCSQVLVAPFADPHQNLSATTGMLPWNKPHPGGKMSAILELAAISDGCDDCCSRLRAYTVDARDPLASGIRAEDRLDATIKGFRFCTHKGDSPGSRTVIQLS